MLKLFYIQLVQHAAASHFIYRQEGTMLISWTHALLAVTWKELISLHQTRIKMSKCKKSLYRKLKKKIDDLLINRNITKLFHVETQKWTQQSRLTLQYRLVNSLTWLAFNWFRGNSVNTLQIRVQREENTTKASIIAILQEMNSVQYISLRDRPLLNVILRPILLVLCYFLRSEKQIYFLSKKSNLG